MTRQATSPLATDKMKKAIKQFSELVAAHPEKTRLELLRQIELQFDLSPLECEFLDKYLSGDA